MELVLTLFTTLIARLTGSKERSLVSRRGAAVVLALTAIAATHVVAQEAPSPFVVGVWGEGDAIIPFADFDGRRWRNNWPAPVETEPSPRGLKQIPAAWWGSSAYQPAWELVEADGRRRTVRITGTGAAGLGSGCSRNLALKTDAGARSLLPTHWANTCISSPRASSYDGASNVEANARPSPAGCGGVRRSCRSKS
jgi:hypothetical protein